MADTRSRGGKKRGTDKPEGQTEQHQTVDDRDTRADQEPGGRPPADDYPHQRPPTGDPTCCPTSAGPISARVARARLSLFRHRAGPCDRKC